MNKIRKSLLLVIVMLILSICQTAFASEDDDWLNGLTNTFYIPRSRFMTDYDYELYCERMYNQGYMDDNYEWTPAAQNYINNMTPENYDALDTEARALVQERIENGDMKASDSPYITYEERQELLKKESQSAGQDGATPTVSTEGPAPGETTPQTGVESGTMEPVVSETPAVNPEGEEKSGRSIYGLVMAVLICGILFGSLYLYKRQS